ncbi:MAG: hypothetical protein EU536_00310 [Promethearchaeota archaeon]|nr:MAG: hypothetical protein EU536_00310 [Candidatus Lokiarchaeota archaeon]
MEDKEHQRYILFELIADSMIDEKDLIRTIWRNLFQLYGDVGASNTGLWLVEYEKNKYGIIRTNDHAVTMIKATLAIIRQVNGIKCIFSVKGVSGTIKSLKEKHLSKVMGVDEEPISDSQ